MIYPKPYSIYLRETQGFRAILHDLSIPRYPNAQGITYFGSCMVFNMHLRAPSKRIVVYVGPLIGFHVSWVLTWGAHWPTGPLALNSGCRAWGLGFGVSG